MDRQEFTSNFRSIVLDDTPLIDVRAPIEFQKGAFLNSVNLPIMNDEERHQVGIIYKQEGNTQAVKLGHQLVSGTLKEQRVQAWRDFISQNPQALLYCFRGGQRSQIAQEFIRQTGTDITRIRGGYKAFRNYLLGEIERSPRHLKALRLGGHTGSGKTILLNTIENSIDLEGLANHRGSSFGRKITPQPSQINFENNLAFEIIKAEEKEFKNVVFEDEGKFIGSLCMPTILTAYLSNTPLIILEASLYERVETTFDEYIARSQKSYLDHEERNMQDWIDDMIKAINRIAKRIGGKRYKELQNIFDDALKQQQLNGSLESYKEFVKYLLVEYYDPMYDYQIQKRLNTILFRGTCQEVTDYLMSCY